MKWSTALPYDLAFDMETTRIEPLSLIEGKASGELEGVGRWTLRPDGSKCNVRYDWIVKVTKPWMVRLAFILKPVFSWNHAVVMERGRRGLVSPDAECLTAVAIASRHDLLPPQRDRTRELRRPKFL